ncbi:Dicer-like protein 1, partial [Coemansia helicoidea]
ARLGHKRSVECVVNPGSPTNVEGGEAKHRKVGAGDGGAKRQKAGGDDLAADDVYQELPPECWTIVQAPKILGDILESLVGAVLLDSGMDNEAARGVYMRLVSPFLDRFVDTGKLSLHPIIHCLLICQKWGCSMISWEGRAGDDQLDPDEKYQCSVLAHGQAISTGTGESPRHAKFNAAGALLQLIGAVAPNAIDGNLSAMHSLPAVDCAADGTQESMLDKLLRPICNCAERRQEEADMRAAAEAERAAAGDAAQSGETEMRATAEDAGQARAAA